MKTKIFYDFEATSVSRDVSEIDYDFKEVIKQYDCNTSLCNLDFKIITSEAFETDVYYIYVLVDKFTKEAFYVGKGKNRRCFMHEWGVKNNIDFKNPHKFRKLKNIMQKEGYYIIIPFTSKIEKEVLAKEMELIRYFGKNNLCNLTDGGEWNPMSDAETKEKVRQFHIGKKRTKETCEKISKARKGNPLSKEHSEKIKQSLLGNKRAGHKVKVILPDGSKIEFNSINEMKGDKRITANTVTISKKLHEQQETIIKGIKYIKI